MSFLIQQDWPGNIRQLWNAIETAFFVCRDTRISESDLTQFHWKFASTPLLGRVVSSPLATYLPVQREPDALWQALEATSWNKTKTAELLQ
jgi:transcriptional regulator of acetoin/glycerol metabolism